MEFYGEITEFYTYRKAMTNHSVYIELDKFQKECLRSFLGNKFGNHITWKADKLYYTYSDGTLYIGTSINIKNW